MATTTPNFGWAVPTSSDLVKNGAVAIETLGDSIDASLVDLKGGTTGQVLAKASNTDMDFVWAADAGAPESLGFAAGKNKIINGDFRVAQRGTSFSNPASAAFSLDRWNCTYGGSITTWTISQQSFTPGTAPVSGYEAPFFYRSAITTIGTGADIDHGQRIEDVRTFAGQTVTLSFWAKADSSRTSLVYFVQVFGSGGSGAVATSTTSINVTTSWQRFTATIAIPSISGKTIGTGSYLLPLIRQAAANASTLDIWGVQVEAGSTATAFQTATGTIQGELAACQRYYERATAGNAYEVFAQGWATSTTNLRATYYYRVPKRVAATSLDFSTLRTSANVSVSNVTADALGNYSANVNATTTGLTTNNFYFLLADNSTNAYLGFSAEL